MIDHTLETSEDKDGDSDTLSEHKELISSQTLTIVEEDGSTDLTIVGAADEQVTYRVVSVRQGENVEGLPQIVSANTNYTGNAAQPGVQALLTNPINVINSDVGQFYVIGSPQDVFTQSPRSLVTRSGIQIENVRSSGAIRPRDDRRRATHNEVERRRRDKINNWIMKLSKIIPECTSDSSKGNFEAQSKGGILAKACDYIMELRSSNQRLAEYSKENEQLVSDMEVLGRQIEELRMENDQLRAQLAEHGISPCLDPLTIT